MNPAWLLVLVFIVVPLAELYLLIEVGRKIGAGTTVALVVLTAVLGALLLRHQGFFTLQRVRASLDRGEAPALPLLEGAVLLLGGLCLMIPGFLTDVLGVLSLIPPLRRGLIKRFLGVWLHRPPGGPGPGGPAPPRPPRTLEGEYERED
ncbi:MAG: FxsA family protein [Gammaproteobacteria bacterium]|nr:FxsA family protein [Gammaproteobacteria bacterium]NIR97414.1 FxsA family protein [Gammaproteobacteria bacterium]NIT63063.1 FxsA family protein [Gammaproteobacteria bacterium]NIV21349.1 FxsA family protein [Gammaproteobacteria bacterium]NIX11193.1 FxsA family protein [Gammaproteobacteria bacterium]